MVRLSLRQDIDCDVETFWQHFFDPELARRLYVEGLGFPAYTTVRQHETATTIERTSAIEPKLTIPAPLARVFGSSFRYTEEGVFDRATATWRWKMISGTLPDKIRVTGTLRAVPVGPARVTREVEIEIEARVPLLGGLVEDTFKKQLSAGWERSAVVENQWLREVAAT
ncbi:MAG TPA: DUF2505 family protein [Nannocystis sp.]|jgi:hypothetical protein